MANLRSLERILIKHDPVIPPAAMHYRPETLRRLHPFDCRHCRTGILCFAQSSNLRQQLVVNLQSRMHAGSRRQSERQQKERRRADHGERISHAGITVNVLIVADDLTGACDAAAPFAARGAKCQAALWSSPLACPDVMAVSTESRDLDEPEIIRRMEAVVQASSPATLVFKKIDSTLRGNVRAEILAAMTAFDRRTAVITPSFPDMGRKVREGYLHIDGETPIHCHERIGLSMLDAADNQDLDRIVAENLHQSEPVLWAGSAGLASALARRLYGNAQPLIAPGIDGPLVFCIGSDHPATLAQVRELNRPILPIRRAQTTPDEIRRSLRGAGALFITGGDTASAVLFAIGARAIAIQHEVVTGVPWGVLSGGSFDGRPVVTKSGGFGAPDTLVRVAEFFTCRKP